MWYQIALFSPVLLLIYRFITDFIPLYPYNDISRHTHNKWECLNYALLALAVLGVWHNSFVSLSYALIIASLAFVGHIVVWWVPYLFGCSEETKREFEYSFGRTITFLPAINDNPIPRVQHLPATILTSTWFLSMIQLLKAFGTQAFVVVVPTLLLTSLLIYLGIRKRVR